MVQVFSAAPGRGEGISRIPAGRKQGGSSAVTRNREGAQRSSSNREGST
jgi:hypothetical protein